jgi:uncharacterized protein (TIGR03067 family)
MRLTVLLMLVINAQAMADVPSSNASKVDLDQMQGSWQAIAMERDGLKIPEDDAQALFRTVKGNEYTVYRYDQAVGKGTFQIDATKKPKTIDAAPAKGKPMLGIYEINGNIFKVCFAMPGQMRPTDFTTAEDSGRTVTIWEREKK